MSSFSCCPKLVGWRALDKTSFTPWGVKLVWGHSRFTPWGVKLDSDEAGGLNAWCVLCGAKEKEAPPVSSFSCCLPLVGWRALGKTSFTPWDVKLVWGHSSFTP